MTHKKGVDFKNPLLFLTIYRVVAERQAESHLKLQHAVSLTDRLFIYTNGKQPLKRLCRYLSTKSHIIQSLTPKCMKNMLKLFLVARSLKTG